MVDWGNGLVLSQVINGGIFRLSRSAFDIEVIAGITPTRTIDFDTSRPSFDFDTHRGFYGIKTQTAIPTAVGRQRSYAYLLLQQDCNRSETYSPQVVDQTLTTRFQYDSFYVGLGVKGNVGDCIEYGLEAVFEGGSAQGTDLPDLPLRNGNLRC